MRKASVDKRAADFKKEAKDLEKIKKLVREAKGLANKLYVVFAEETRELPPHMKDMAAVSELEYYGSYLKKELEAVDEKGLDIMINLAKTKERYDDPKVR